MRHPRLVSLLALLLSVLPARSAPLDYYLPADTPYAAGVPRPAEVLGWEVGEWHVRHAQIAQYFRALEQASPRVKLEPYARSHEQQPLFHAVITAPENHARLEELRQQHLRLSDPARSAELDLDRQPLVVLLGYGIHGNEPSGPSAALLIAYHLAAAEDEETRALLRDTIVLVDPCLNPDGLDRFAGWANSHRGRHPSADPADREHNEVWPRGRTNHYWFDLNRDWLPLVHPESRGRVEQFHRWKPHLLTDVHEMGTNTTYFFQPGIPSRENPGSPPAVAALTARIARHHAAGLDAAGSLYYARETFDDFYPGKGSTYPDVNGGIGILFEQASSRGHVQRSDHGLLTFPFTIRNQVITSFTSLRAARELRRELMEHQRTFFREAAGLAAQAGVAGWVFDAAEDPARTWHFLDVLRRHQVEVRALTAPVRGEGREFRPGEAWVVPAAQPQFRYAREIFARRKEFADALFYDISAWTLPLAYNLAFAELKTGELPAAALGEPVGQPFFPAGRVAGGGEAYAYVFNWTGYYAPRALQRLHAAGILAKGASRAFELATDEGLVKFGPGAVVVPVGVQPEKRARIEDIVAAIAREDAITVHAVGGGAAAAGPDLGSPSFHVLPPPAVALLVGEGVDALDAGSAWHLLDVRVGLAPTLLELSRMNAAVLARHNVVVMADGNYGSLDDGAVAALKDWVRAGNTLVALGRAVEWLGRQEFAKLEFVRAAQPKDRPDRIPYADGPRAEGLQLVRGAILGAHLDVTHPLGYGYTRPELPVFKANRIYLKRPASPYLSPAVFNADPVLAGHVSAENAAAAAGSAAVAVAHLGGGRLVLAPDNPNFRGMWLGGSKLFLNAVFHGTAIRPVGAGGDYGEE